jgi:hypothetical protein
MALIAFASTKGAPGVTTAALVVGALWPRPVMVADCDLGGGDLGIRLPAAAGGPIDPERGLISLASAARHGLRPEQVESHVQTLLGGLPLLAGLQTPEQKAAMASLWPVLGSCLDAIDGVDVIADCGRLIGDTAQLAMLRAARLVVLFCQPTVVSVLHLRERLASLEPVLRPGAVDGVPVGVVVVTDAGDTRGVEGVRNALARRTTAAPVLGHLAWDPKGAAYFDGELEGRVDRTLLVRSGRELATVLARRVLPVPTGDPVPAPVSQAVQS